jgi:hypothetical protein
MSLRCLTAALSAAAAVVGIGLTDSPAAQADPPYANCKQAAQDGRYNIPRGDPAYSPKLDRDNDGIACESH